jgi:hypothetical protein
VRSLDLAVEGYHILSGVVEVAEFGAGASGGVAGGEAEGDEVGDAGLEVKVQLGLDVGVDAFGRAPG